MAVSKHQILASLAGLEKRAPLYFGGMPVADDAVRDAVAAAMAGLSSALNAERASRQAIETTLLASMTHLLLELVHHEHMACDPAAVAANETRRLLARAAAH